MTQFHEKLVKLHNRAVWAELIAIVGFTLLMCVYISPGSFRHSLGFMLQNPLVIALNALPIAVMLLVIYFICSNSFASGQRLWVLDASPRYYEIYVDNLTGVQYLRTYKGGVCVMVDAEGRPLIWEEEK